MTDLVAALGLVLVIEGVFYAGFPDAAKAYMRQALGLPESSFRAAGLVAAAVGLVLMWLVRG
jgi:uncharacterized protein YjeT (DUF2065 family)